MLNLTSLRHSIVLLALLSAACLPLTVPTAEPSEPPPVDWTPQFRAFDGVEMALVPAGCFMMGSDTGETDERPVQEQCMTAPYWIDRYEVTNAQYGSAGAFDGDTRPRDSLTWFEASAFCAGRGGRLPTELEWEYAARSTANHVYPWGNRFVSENLVYDANSAMQSAPVGSRPAGASWVGAEDMSGNLWEWTSSVYRFYPYDAGDGRESPNDLLPRVVRGGGWVSEVGMTRAANRAASEPAHRDSSIGFRCVRDDAP
ncbi:MAG: formylglycine-generating enzyme family protein [Anaerolineae bacterium]